MRRRTRSRPCAPREGTFDTLVIGTGYDDFASLFARDSTRSCGRRGERGIARIVWFNYRELVGYTSPGQVSYAATFAANNATLRTLVASGAYPEVTIADWNGYSASRPRWFTADGVHITGDGTQEAAMYLSRTLAFLDRRPCPAGMGGPVTAGRLVRVARPGGPSRLTARSVISAASAAAG